jgi:hypothetical protein
LDLFLGAGNGTVSQGLPFFIEACAGTVFNAMRAETSWLRFAAKRSPAGPGDAPTVDGRIPTCATEMFIGGEFISGSAI